MQSEMTMLCEELNNWFVTGYAYSTFTIQNGALVTPFDLLKDGQYFRIVGSLYNDGVYKYPASGLTDEVFRGDVWAMAVPPSVVALADEIKSFTESNESKVSAYTSESFGGYSYSKAVDENGAPLSWQKVFASRLNRWRKL